jgi:two-component system, LuxR family, sensor kinase FixL
VNQTGVPKQNLNEVHELVSELEKYRQIVETANDAVVSINAQHEVVFMNRAAEEMFGYGRNEILGGDLSPLIPSEYRKDHKSFVERYVKTRQPRFIGHVAQVQAEHRDGRRFPISISFSVAESNNELLLTAIMRDLTAERDLAMQVKRAERLATVGEMVATVSHEIRTPLTLIGGFAGQLLREKGLSERGKRKMGIIVEEVARLEKMLSELNDLSRVQPYDWEELDLADVVDHVKVLMGPRLKRDRFFFDLRKENGLPKVVADRNRLSQVLINLVNNAVQASVPGDEIIMELVSGASGGVDIRVRDFGAGIPEKHMAEVFNPFFTTKKRGTGLGLPLAKRIVGEHGGSIELQSNPESGTVATVHLPIAPELAKGSQPTPPTVSDACAVKAES